jgi:hypothetical protein
MKLFFIRVVILSRSYLLPGYELVIVFCSFFMKQEEHNAFLLVIY